MRFTVYPKGDAKPFTLVCEELKIEYPNGEANFTLVCEELSIHRQTFVVAPPKKKADDASSPSVTAFLSFADIAAIVPENQNQQQGDLRDRYNPIVKFHVNLKNRSQPIHVYSHAFKPNENGRVVFLRIEKDSNGKTIGDPQEIKNVYIATSEVVAILPSDGLEDDKPAS